MSTMMLGFDRPEKEMTEEQKKVQAVLRRLLPPPPPVHVSLASLFKEIYSDQLVDLIPPTSFWSGK